MSARDEVLRRVRAALADRPSPPPVVRDYRTGRGTGDVALFAERVTDYRASVHRTADPAAVIASLLGGTRVAVPNGFPDEWIPAADVVREPVSTADLDAVHAVLTTCAIAIAETGTIVLDHGPGMGPRALTLVPDRHVVVVLADQIVAGVPDALALLDPLRPQTWISGPSATSDIELDRVEGVHGPRVLDVVVHEPRVS